MRHKHADLIHAWAEGAEIQRLTSGLWMDMGNTIAPSFCPNTEYRLKPQKKPDVVKFIGLISKENRHYFADEYYVIGHWPEKLKLTFCGETGKLIKAEVI